MFRYIDAIFAYLAITLIKLYQATLSPDHGWFKKPYGHCRFQPTCSEYCLTSISKYGFIKGGFKCSYRILRCNPFNKGGWDPVK
jgi:hypothetical protein